VATATATSVFTSAGFGSAAIALNSSGQVSASVNGFTGTWEI
jgi:hypothetical protein